MLWYVTQTTQDYIQLNQRLRLIETERSRSHLAAAESMLDDLQAEIERKAGTGVLFGVALRERAILRDDEGRSNEAIPLYERALAIFRAEPAAGSTVLGLTLANLASAHADCGDFASALSLATEAMTMLRSLSTPEFAVALYAHGAALHGLGRNTEALHDLREALNVWEETGAPDQAQVALAKETIAACLWDLGFSSRAEASERESLAIRTKAFGAGSLGAAESLNNLGVILAREQRFSEGEQSLDRAAFILERIGERGVRHLIAVLGNLGTLYFMQAPKNIHFYSEAEKVYRRKLALEEPLFGDLDIRVSATLELLGEALYGERAYDEAGQTFGRGLALQEAALGPADPRTQAAVKRYHILTKKVKAYAMK